MKCSVCAIAALAFACGSGKDESAAFVGTWPGAILDVGFSDTIPRTAVIARSGSNELTISGLCAAPISASVQDAHTFTFDAVRGCLTGASSSCNSAQLSIDGGTGMLTLNGDLAIDMPGAVTACGSLLGGVQAVFKSNPRTGAVANLLVSITATPSPSTSQVRVPIRATAGVRTPSGAPLKDPRYTWTLIPPAGSSANLSSPGAAETSFNPDVPGTYTLTLAVQDGDSTGFAVVLWAVTNPAPVAALSAPQWVVTGAPVALDASGSVDANGDQLTFRWTLLSAPSGSAAAIAGVAAVAHLTPDLPGAYTASVEVGDGTSKSTATVTVNAAVPVPQLPFVVTAARYSRALDRLVLVSASPDLLHLFDPFTFDDQTIALPSASTVLSLTNDGSLALVGNNQSLPLAIVDLAARQITKTWTPTRPVGRFLLGDEVSVAGRTTRYAYEFSDNFVEVRDIGSDAVTVQGLPFAVTDAALVPGVAALVTFDGFTGDLVHYSIDPSGALSRDRLNRDPNSASLPGSVWVSADGASVITGHGHILKTSDFTDTGVTVPSFVRWADWSVNGDGFFGDTQGWMWSATSLALVEQPAFPPFVRNGSAVPLVGRYGFFDASGARRVVLAELSNADPNLADPHLAVVVY